MKIPARNLNENDSKARQEVVLLPYSRRECQCGPLDAIHAIAHRSVACSKGNGARKFGSTGSQRVDTEPHALARGPVLTRAVLPPEIPLSQKFQVSSVIF